MGSPTTPTFAPEREWLQREPSCPFPAVFFLSLAPVISTWRSWLLCLKGGCGLVWDCHGPSSVFLACTVLAALKYGSKSLGRRSLSGGSIRGKVRLAVLLWKSFVWVWGGVVVLGLPRFLGLPLAVAPAVCFSLGFPLGGVWGCCVRCLCWPACLLAFWDIGFH